MSPQPSLVTDGGWSKEATIKHTYDALGGVAIIIQYETEKKLLHTGVRNKYCNICSTSQTKMLHQYHRRVLRTRRIAVRPWRVDIILEGFKEEHTHGVRYMRLLGEGDLR